MIYILLTWLLTPLWWPVSRVSQLLMPVPRRILIAEIAGIGDVVCSTAVFRAVRDRFPDAHIALMVDTVVAPLAAQDAAIDQVIPFAYGAQRGFAGRLKLAAIMSRFDTFICLIPSAAQLSAACWACVPRRYSLLPDVRTTSYQLLSPLMTHTVSHITHTTFVGSQLQLLAPLGVAQDCLERHLVVQESSRMRVRPWLHRPATRWVGLAVGSGQGIKAIRPAILEAVVQRLLADATLGVVLIGGGKEEALANRLVAAHESDRLVNTAGQIALEDIPALIERLAVFIGVDSGVAYIADTLAIPMVYLPGPASPRDQGPIKARRVTLQKSLDCAPCSRVFVTPKSCATGTQACIAGFTADDIYNAVVSLLEDV